METAWIVSEARTDSNRCMLQKPSFVQELRHITVLRQDSTASEGYLGVNGRELPLHRNQVTSVNNITVVIVCMHAVSPYRMRSSCGE